MTAIASLYTQSGFILGADGRQRWCHLPSRNATVISQESDRIQKVFRAASRNIELGCVIVGDTANLERSFDFAAEVQSQVNKLRGSSFPSCREYVDVLTSNLEDAIKHLKHSGELEGYPETFLHFVGYFKESACVIDVDFRRFHGLNGSIRQVKAVEDFHPGWCFVRGSLVIGRSIVAGDPLWSRYAKPISRDMSLSDASEFAKGYIEACSSPQAMEIDPDIASTIGGHIHIAAITPANGFYWVVPPFRASFISRLFGS